MEEYSYSKLTRYESCPLAYMRKYLNGEKQQSHGITECGLFMHDLLERYERGELKLEEMLPYFEENFYNSIKSDTHLKLSENFSKDMYPLYYNGFLEYLQNFNGIKDCKEIIDVEKEFHLQYNDYIITGKIDLVFVDKYNNFCVLDHKSKNKFKNKKEQSEYARQLYLYAWASKTLYGKYPQKLIFNMLRGEYIYIPFKENDMFKALEWFDKTVNDIRTTITYDAKEGTFFCNNFCSLDKIDLCTL